LTAVRHIDPVPNPGSGVLVGRDGELAALRAGFETALSGRPTIILLMGEAGIGKTRLADEAALLARASGTRVLRGEADALSREPMELWRGVYRALGIQPVGDPSLPAEERRWEHLELLADALVSTAPAVVVIEDLHWADPIAIWVLEGALITGNGKSVMFQQVNDYSPPQWPDPAHPQQAHLDIIVEDLEAAHARAVELGATVLNGGGQRFRTFADPAGHPFDLTL
jgi:hypothetical protein